MRAAYDVVFDAAKPGCENKLDGHALARCAQQVDAIANRLGFLSLDAYRSQAAANARGQLADLLGVDDEFTLPADAAGALEQMLPETWFESQHGLEFARQVRDYICENASSVSEPDAVIHDLDCMARVMEEGVKLDLRWHFHGNS